MRKIFSTFENWQTVVSFIAHHPLTQRKKASALGRLLRWQIHRRLSHKLLNVPYVNRGRLLLDPGAQGLTGCYYVGLPDFEEAAFALHLLRPGEIFADVGANAGAWSIMMAAGSEAKVDAFEPIPESLARLQTNVDANRMGDQVSVHRAGVGREVGQLRFTTNNGTGNHVVTDEHITEGALEIPVTTLDQTYARHCPQLIKIDVEGWELEVIQGARGILQNPALLAFIIETFRVHNLNTPVMRQMEAILAEHGFYPCAYHPFERWLDDVNNKPRPTDNTIYIRDKDAVQTRLWEATPFSVLGWKI